MPGHILAILGELEHESAIVVRKRDRFGFTNTDFIAVKDPDTSRLSPAELEMVEDLRAHICDEHTADSISKLSHDQIWEAANIGEELPLSASLVALAGEISEELLNWAGSVLSRYEQVSQAA